MANSITSLKIKALGQTIDHEGEVVLVVQVPKMPANCMVLFVDLDTWKEIKEDVEIIK